MQPTLASIQEMVRQALLEDLPELRSDADQTAGLIDASIHVEAEVCVREPAILCGCAWFEQTLGQLDKSVQVKWQSGLQDGSPIKPGTICCVTGQARGLLAGERTALNFLQTLSGIATRAAHYAQLAKEYNYKGQILDTRKTLPGLRAAQKYAVRVGGCANHRLGLFDAILIKENHLFASPTTMEQLVRKAQHQGQGKPIMLEVENLTQLKTALTLPLAIILLDNFAVADVARAIALKQQTQSPILLEISGIQSEAQLRQLLALHPDRISLGDLTKNCQAIDFSMRFVKQTHS